MRPEETRGPGLATNNEDLQPEIDPDQEKSSPRRTAGETVDTGVLPQEYIFARCQKVRMHSSVDLLSSGTDAAALLTTSAAY